MKEPLPDINNIRVPQPDRYSGNDDIEKFDIWWITLQVPSFHGVQIQRSVCQTYFDHDPAC